MVYLVVFAALMFNSLKGYNGKKVSILARRAEDPYFFSLVRMAICVVIGLAIVLISGATLRVDLGMLGVCALAGVANVVFLVAWMMAVQHNPMVTVDVTMTLGSIIPAVLCAALFSDAIKGSKFVGFALIVLASFIMSGYKKQQGKSSFIGVIWLLLTVLGDGIIGFSQQLYIKFYQEGGALAGERVYPMSVYHFYTYVFAFLAVAIVLAVLLLRRDRAGRKEYCAAMPTTLRPALIHIVVMASFLFISTYLQTVATGVMGMPSQVLYPVIKGGSLIVSNLIAIFMFGEKPTFYSISGSFVALGGIILMNAL